MMGVSAKKENLIRRLLRERIEDDPSAAEFGQDASFAGKMPVTMLLGMPEATIVTCVESWAELKKQGIKNAEIAKRIAAFRRVPTDKKTVNAVIMQIVIAEHGHGGYLPVPHITYCIVEAQKVYGLK